MTSDASDYRDVQESADVTRESSGVAFGLSPSGKKAMQGGDVAAPPPDH
jgi:hypothetical protein